MSNVKSDRDKITDELKTKLNRPNRLAVPRLEKVVLNIGIGKARDNEKFRQAAHATLESIAGQKPKLTLARKAISGFKVREKDEVGLVVTLRGKRMDDFVKKMANIVLPRMRDFRGVNPKGFDRGGNLTIGFPEQIVFPEITHEKAEIIHGLSVTLVTTAKNAAEAKVLLEALGFPFRK